MYIINILKNLNVFDIINIWLLIYFLFIDYHTPHPASCKGYMILTHLSVSLFCCFVILAQLSVLLNHCMEFREPNFALSRLVIEMRERGVPRLLQIYSCIK